MSHYKHMYACGEHIAAQCRCPGPKETTILDVVCPTCGAKPRIKDMIKSVPDFPIPGVTFRDFSPILRDPIAFKHLIKSMSDKVKRTCPYLIGGVDARGFILGTAIAYELGLPFVMIRKGGKMPDVVGVNYACEYGTGRYEMARPEYSMQRIHIVDDVLATGGSLQAIVDLAKAEGYDVTGCSVLIDLEYLHKPDFKVWGMAVESEIRIED